MTRQIPLTSLGGTYFDVVIRGSGVNVANLGPLVKGRRQMQGESASDASKPGTWPSNVDNPKHFKPKL